ncbi:MAG: FKBP-type peptidyl-prolyl cis-trans isomerase [Spirochaetaceae bacterium]|jgi:FKBP-type peptidyl-prolyl cis-trans isomerase|nr:FKBP-type peptidyl-prolyl cis-trans isomerase [Spirochaetaceae bacterium]
MKKYMAMVVTFLLLCTACKGNEKNATDEYYVFDADVSYALGVNIASELKSLYAKPDYKAFLQGFQDCLENNETKTSQTEGNNLLNTAFREAEVHAEKINAEKAEANAEKAKIFMQENGKKSGVISTESGLQYEVVKAGDGAKPTADNVVSVNYTGTLVDGTLFDSNKEMGAAVDIPLNGVIPGFSEGLQLMSVGSSYKFYIPPELAYGPNSRSPIPPNSVLIFDVELVKIEE